MDLQAVLCCPKTLAGAMYYKTKLQVRNSVFFNRKSKDGACYMWTDTEGNLSSEVFANIQQIHFRKMAQTETYEDIDTIIVWSDGCGYQVGIRWFRTRF